ncbi:hypothetical protein H5410_021025 [Solanum commersonii]|uniref:Uncharacterized protein n=1 Tax=Solanum commersonii TaxID=4109 RepID=A0A9J5ZD23_SOLCO|nr:hypothetical protein H5410_021025 [Solanum commersonii]
MCQTRLSNVRATTGVPEAPNVTSARQPTSSRNRSTTIRTSREVTPEKSTSPPPTSQDNATTGVLASMQKAIESLVNRMDRQERDGQHNVAATQTHALLQTPAQTYTFGNKERQKYATQFESLVQTLDMDVENYNAKFGKLAKYAPLLVPTKADRVQRFVHGLVSRLFNALAPNISTMTYSKVDNLAREIEDKGQEERATYDVRKKAKIGGSYSGDLGANHITENQGRQQQGCQTGMDKVSSTQGHHNSGKNICHYSILLDLW